MMMNALIVNLIAGFIVMLISGILYYKSQNESGV